MTARLRVRGSIGHARDLRRLRETDERLFTVAAWRDAPCFTGAERAALAPAEAVTRIGDRLEAVADGVWTGGKALQWWRSAVCLPP